MRPAVSVRSEADQDWGRRNQRRLELIRQSTRWELTLPDGWLE